MIIDESKVFLDVNLTNKNKVLSYIAEKAVLSGITENKNGVLQDLINREKNYPTAISDGVAIPHAKSPHVNNASLFFLRLKESIDWESEDDFQAKLIFAILVPEKEAGTKHIEILSKVAVKLLEEDFITEITELEDKKIIVEKILESEE